MVGSVAVSLGSAGAVFRCPKVTLVFVAAAAAVVGVVVVADQTLQLRRPRDALCQGLVDLGSPGSAEAVGRCTVTGWRVVAAAWERSRRWTMAAGIPAA